MHIDWEIESAEGYYVQTLFDYSHESCYGDVCVGWCLVGDKAYAVHSSQYYEYDKLIDSKRAFIGWKNLKDLPKDLQKKLKKSALFLQSLSSEEERSRQIPRLISYVDIKDTVELTDSQVTKLLADQYDEAMKEAMPLLPSNVIPFPVRASHCNHVLGTC